MADGSVMGAAPMVVKAAGSRVAGSRVAGLRVSVGAYSDRGRKAENQDFQGAAIPGEPARTMKGVALAIADGISTSPVSGEAAAAAVTGFLSDYFCTSEAWSVKSSALRVLEATNSWLRARNRSGDHRFDLDRGYVCTFTALVIKAATAHLFHVGDTRLYRLAGAAMECLTTDHRVSASGGRSYLARALGVENHLEIEHRAFGVLPGDTFILASDGLYEHVEPRLIAETIARHEDDLDAAARAIGEAAFENGSPDNITLQIVRVDAIPDGAPWDVNPAESELPLPPALAPRMEFDGYLILRELRATNRSHIFLAGDQRTGSPAVLKTPSIDMRDDPEYIRRFLLEDWVARRIDSAHVVKPLARDRRPGFVYVAMEYIDGRTLTQWMADNPKPDLETVRGIVEQIAKGLRAFHRLEMLHQDLRPDNVMIDRDGTVKIIDFGSTLVAGVAEASPRLDTTEVLGTVQYVAPEYLLGEGGTTRSDLFSLGVIAYQMLTGRLPYGDALGRTRGRAAMARLRYASALDDKRDVPVWIDGVLRRAVAIDPAERYGLLSEFLYDLRHPPRSVADPTARPLAERDPLMFWKCLSLALAATVVALLGVIAKMH